LGLPATSLARWNEASPDEIYATALAALRVGLEPAEWSKVQAEVHDPVREHLRDAQLDHLVGQGTFSSREAVADALLTDVQMSSCMTTTRIQFCCGAVQRYVEAGQAGRAPWPPPSEEEGFARRWASLRQYRLHEAQMRILVHAENWIDPAIRPSKTPAFERLEQTMTSGPLTSHLAEQAVKEYAASLAEIARLETIAIVTHDRIDADRPLAFRDSELHGTHVFARTCAHPQRLYYRRRLPEPDGRRSEPTRRRSLGCRTTTSCRSTAPTRRDMVTTPPRSGSWPARTSTSRFLQGRRSRPTARRTRRSSACHPSCSRPAGRKIRTSPRRSTGGGWSSRFAWPRSEGSPSPVRSPQPRASSADG
jgi:hypothetical protein